MPDHPTPGQIAFTAYTNAANIVPLADPTSTYQLLHGTDRAAWEAAAQAAIAAWWRQHEHILCRDEEEDTHACTTPIA